MITMDKKYKTANGSDVLVKFTDGPTSCPAGVITCGLFVGYNNNMLPVGMDVHPAVYCAMRLVEVSPYDDFKIDEPVMVRDFDHSRVDRRYFAGVRHDGKPTAWERGCTSWTASKDAPVVSWNQCRRPTAEELAS